MEERGVPVTVITGYLGSGKTTLLKRLLENPGCRVAVLMNEFGEVGIDSKTVAGENVEMKELLGGCICCSLTGEFEAALREVLEKARPDKIVIETTGLAEPDAMIVNMDGIEGVYLDSVVTIVDAGSFTRFPKIGHTGRVQIEMADVVVLNKTDLASVDEIREIEHAIRRINPEARIVKTTYSAIDAGSVFGLGTERVREASGEPHEPSFTDSFVYRSDKTISRPRFMLVVSELPKEIYRAKGHVRFPDGGHLFNFVNGRHSMSKSDSDGNELVFIGEGISGVKDDILDKIRRAEM